MHGLGLKLESLNPLRSPAVEALSASKYIYGRMVDYTAMVTLLLCLQESESAPAARFDTQPTEPNNHPLLGNYKAI